MVEERFAKMEEYGDDWDDKPVSQTVMFGTLLDLRFTDRYADVVDERGQGRREVSGRNGTANALGQFCGYPFNVFGK